MNWRDNAKWTNVMILNAKWTNPMMLTQKKCRDNKYDDTKQRRENTKMDKSNDASQ